MNVVHVERRDGVRLRQAGEEIHAPRFRGDLQRIVLRRGGAHGHDHHVRPEAVGERAHFLAIRAIGLHEYGGIEIEALRHFQPARLVVEDDDFLRALQPGERRVHDADRPGADDRDGVLQADAKTGVRIHAATERLGERHLVVRDVGGDFEKIALPHCGCRHAHERRESTVVVVAHRGAMRGEILPPHLHVAVAAIHDDDIHHHAVADFYVRLRRARLHDCGAKLMAEDARRNDLPVAVAIGAEVRAAHRAGVDLQ